MAKFIVFEGIDGSGKTTQINRLYEALEKQGVPVHITKEPTDGDMGKLLRDYLTGRKHTDLCSIAALFAADRLDHINSPGGIRDNLARGNTVLCDRYYLSSYAYQWADCDLDWVRDLNREAERSARPDLVIFLDVPAGQSMARVTSRGETELFEEKEKQQKIKDNFYKLFDIYRDKENIVIIDGTRDIDTIAAEVLCEVKKIL